MKNQLITLLIISYFIIDVLELYIKGEFFVIKSIIIIIIIIIGVYLKFFKRKE